MLSNLRVLRALRGKKIMSNHGEQKTHEAGIQAAIVTLFMKTCTKYGDRQVKKIKVILLSRLI